MSSSLLPYYYVHYGKSRGFGFFLVKDGLVFFLITVEDRHELKKSPLFYNNFHNTFFSYAILCTFVFVIFAFFSVKFC